jgi:hypothetical protein
VEDSQHHQAHAVVTILEYVHCVQNLQHYLPVFVPSCYWPTESWVLFQNTRGIDNLLSHDPRKMGMMSAKESGKAIKIGKRIRRPLKLH